MEAHGPEHGAQVDRARVVVPADHLCAKCGYPSGVSGSVVCPECGWEVSGADLAAADRRREAFAPWRLYGRGRWMVGWVAIVVAYWIGLSTLTAYIGIGLVWGIAAACLVPVSWIMGRLVSRGRPVREHRQFARMTWERQLWILHLPWLALPGLAAGCFGLAAAASLARTSGGPYLVATLVFGVVWCVGCFVCLGTWWARRSRAHRSAGLLPVRWPDRWAFVGGLLVWLAAGMLGFSGGAAAAMMIGIFTGALPWD
jgi:hypothetical protein